MLIGEHVDNRPDTDDAGKTDLTLVVETFASAGVPAIVTLTGRDRSLRQARAEASGPGPRGRRRSTASPVTTRPRWA